jgi:hypothetical protein
MSRCVRRALRCSPARHSSEGDREAGCPPSLSARCSRPPLLLRQPVPVPPQKPVSWGSRLLSAVPMRLPPLVRKKRTEKKPYFLCDEPRWVFAKKSRLRFRLLPPPLPVTPIFGLGGPRGSFRPRPARSGPIWRTRGGAPSREKKCRWWYNIPHSIQSTTDHISHCFYTTRSICVRS